jgi:hypothetical protein
MAATTRAAINGLIALGHATLQVDHAALGHHLVGVGRDVLGVDQAGLHFGGDDGVAGARGVAGRAGDFHFVDDVDHAFNAAHFAFDLRFHCIVAHFAGQQRTAVEAVDVDVGSVAADVVDLDAALDFNRAVFGLGAEGATVGGRQRTGNRTARYQRDAARQGS